jgi:hypothetical protein
MVSEDNQTYTSLAKVYDFNDAVRIEVSGKCRYIKMVVADKEHGKAASIDLLRIYGHPYFKYEGEQLPSQQKEKVDELLLQYGYNRHQQWEADEESMITLHDMSKLQAEWANSGQQDKLAALRKDFETVLKLAKQIKQLTQQKKYLNAKQEFQQIKDINDEIGRLKQRRDFYDEKYETRRFEDMIALDDHDNHHDQLLKDLLEKDKTALEEERRRSEEEAEKREEELDKEFDELEELEDEWWKKEHELDRIEEEPIKEKKPKVEKTKKPTVTEVDDDYKFKNPYVYNQGDADMEKYIRPLLNEFGGDYTADPELLRKYEQMEYLDILGARIWISAHS